MRGAFFSGLVLAAIGTSGLAQAGMATGAYECWYFSQAQMMLNFTVTGADTYVGSASGESGTYALSGKSLTWASGPLVGIMPDGFTAIYEVRGGIPTVSYVSGRGAEAAFCENAP
jgi:hypothetical protein